MTKFKLATFGKYPWKDLWTVPLMIFHPTGFYKPFYMKDYVAQWVWPHLLALGYLRHHETVFNFGADLNELFKASKTVRIEAKPIELQETPDDEVLNLVQEMLNMRQPKGSFGGYTISTLLSLLAFKDFLVRYPGVQTQVITQSMAAGAVFNEWNYFNPRVPYQGSLDDGRWWDTILISWALAESGADLERLKPIVNNMIALGVQPNGGIAYGYDFEYAPDADDTGLLVQLMSQFGNYYASQIQKSSEWLFTMQNDDGGYPAFDKGKTGSNWLIKTVFDLGGLANSGEVFDPSSPDVTGHILEGLGSTGYNALSSQILHSINYLKEQQTSFGSWEARWGINYIYSMGAVLPGLASIKYDLTEPWIQNSINWLLSKQNPDGGWGETTLSYNQPDLYNGIGNSTVTQTAWALLALLEVKNTMNVTQSIQQGINFLLTDFEARGNLFWDSSVVGTGHRGLVYLQYPSYAYSFPLMALSRYQKRFPQTD